MAVLSKFKILAFRQSPNDFWVEELQPELRMDSGATNADCATGLAVSDVARNIYDTLMDSAAHVSGLALLWEPRASRRKFIEYEC